MRDDLQGRPRVLADVSGVATPRPNVQHVIAALGRALVGNVAERDLPGVFEREVQRLLSMRAVRLREIPARYQVRLVTPTRTADSVVLDVPTTDPRMQAVLEASCDPDRGLDEWDFQVLTTIAQLAGLVLEAARARMPRLPARDGAAPLIGSTPVMQQVRSRVERVAVTDFTVLIEGSIDHEQERVPVGTPPRPLPGETAARPRERRRRESA